MDGLISKIQRYSTNDGPGVRSTVFAVGCPLRCLWCSNPELMDARGSILYHVKRCVSCGACVSVSGGAILPGDHGCIIDRISCTNLDECVEACFHDAYERIGVIISAEELASKLLRDKVFYEQSRGGVTYSGGEAALQAEFFLKTTEILKAESIKSESIHVALDTSGHIAWDKLAPLVEAVDLVLFDIKAFDDAVHKQYTGVDNRLILENARRIADMRKEMIIRLIIVPGVNDDEGEIDARLAFARGLGSVVRVDIIKYHRLGAGKYACLGLSDPMEGTPECPDAPAERAAKRAADMGLAVTIGG